MALVEICRVYIDRRDFERKMRDTKSFVRNSVPAVLRTVNYKTSVIYQRFTAKPPDERVYTNVDHRCLSPMPIFIYLL